MTDTGSGEVHAIIYPTEITCHCGAAVAADLDVTVNEDGSHTFTGPAAYEKYEAHVPEAEQAPS
jgi:hypothetical protein